MDLFEALRAADAVDAKFSLWLSEAATLWGLVHSYPSPNVVEIGVFWGRTSIVLAAAAQRVGGYYWGVDKFGKDCPQSRFIETLQKHGLPFGLLGAASATVPWENGPIDVLLIDGDHEEAGIAKDCEIWLPRIRPGGMVVFDDYDDGLAPHAGIKRQADSHTGSWERVKVSPKLLLARKPV
jgi:predicted O-methyltransferase YrrM